jgi:hypothetical protein
MNKSPTMRVARTFSTATTYQLVVDRPLGGWALCTVNDATGELAIQSDWGNWAYQWSPDPRSLGVPTLTAFLGIRHDVDYVARKLSGRHGGEEFDARASAQALIHLVAAKRFEHGRDAIAYARDRQEWEPTYTREDAENDLDNKPSQRHMTAHGARDLADALLAVAEDISPACESAQTLFTERIINVFDNHDWQDLCEEPWEHFEFTQAHSDRVLRESILPALFEACGRQHQSALLIAANGPQPAIEDSRDASL